MATLSKVGSFTLNATSGNQSITGLGFVPKLVIFWGYQFADGASATIAGAAEAHRFYGAASSPTNQFVALTSINEYNGYMSRQVITTKCIRYNDALSDSAVLEASFVSLDSNGFTINVTTGASNSINYLALGGSGFNGKVGYFDVPAQSGGFSKAVTGVGFKPKAIMLFSAGQMTTGSGKGPEDVDGGDGINIGFACGTASDQQEATSHYYNNTPVAKRSNQQGYCLVYISYDGSGYDARAALSSFDTDGFTLYFDTKWNGSTIRVPYIAMGGSSSYTYVAIDEPSSTGTQTYSTAAGIKPVAQIITSIGYSDLNGAISADSRCMFGATSGTTSSLRKASSISIPETTSPSIYDGGYGNTISDSFAIDAYSTPTNWTSIGDITAYNTGSFTVNWTTVSGTPPAAGPAGYRYLVISISDSPYNPSNMMIGLFN